VYFSKSVETSLLPSFPARGNENLKNRLLDRIDRAEYSIDLALYSLSGAVGDDIAASLISAHNRGVKVRTIFEADNANTAAIRALRNAGVPQIVDSFDPLNAGAGLMHNKVVIVDARDRSSDTDDWIITGSWNPTDPGTDNDAQNVVEIQDQALATTYTKEFEEMWGSATASPNSTASRFGVRKRADTPRRFVVGGIWMDVHFSPSDRTNDYLLRTIRSAEQSIYFALLTFTRDDLGQAMLAAHRAGKAVRGVMDNSSDQGSEFAFFQSNGMNVFLKKGFSGLLHHKYMVVDAERTTGRVVTGSHNWSNAAEFANNENTIGIHSAAIARQFVQEWYRRYLDAGGTGAVVLGVSREPAAGGFSLDAPWPNPATGGTAEIALTTSGMQAVRMVLVDALGREVAVIADGMAEAGRWRWRLDTSQLPAGAYQIVAMQGGRTQVRPLLVVR
jgi:phosphatidylserine/phosphatidylglycerophosphate/cardiolipin synthase-like enzyme